MTQNESADLVDQLLATYAERVARGEAPRPEELIARAPQHKLELERCFRMLDGAPPETGLLARDVVLGDFRLGRELGRGGMSVVYEAEQLSLGRAVALKVLRHHLTLEPRHVERFQREARAAAKLAHEHVVPIHAVGAHDGHAFLAFELVRGPTLAGVIATLRGSGTRPTTDDLARASGAVELARCPSYSAACVQLLRGVFEAIEFAHAAGVIHRDLKPSNILLDARGKPLVADFGLAKDMGQASLSITGEALGTPHYMSPEQAGALAHLVDGRTDVYSLGVTLYELLTLERPFEGDTLQQLVERIATLEVANPHELAADIERTLGDVVLKALSKDPAQRYATARAFCADLERALGGAQTSAAPTAGLGALMQRYFDARVAGAPFEYRSKATLFGLPWMHVAVGVRHPKTKQPVWARGVIAVGDFAVGGYAAGKLAIGGLALGGISIGVASVGVLAFGVAAIGGLAVGWDVGGLMVAGERGVGLFAQSVASARPSNLFVFNHRIHGGPPLPWLVGFTAALGSLTMTHGLWRKRAKTPSAARSVAIVARGVLPLLSFVPAALYEFGMPLPFMAILGYLGAISALGSLFLRRVVAVDGADKHA
jgi:tRNA A-37 threonylcarbamoyl transferase component Bud32